MKDDVPLPPYDFLNGALLLVDKPKGWTSFDVVNKIRHALRKRLEIKKIKVGHAGTLDPMATGLLVICTGKGTKKLNELQGLPKAYTGTLVLGASTPSYDAETEIDQLFPIDHIKPKQVKKVAAGFLGEIQQVPPMFSAIKVDGQPLYKKARKGEKIKVEARTVRIDTFDITRVELPEVDFAVDCSKGTYIRSLAFDLGKALDSGAYLSALTRTRIGPYTLDQAWALEDLIKYIKKGELAGSTM